MAVRPRRVGNRLSTRLITGRSHGQFEFRKLDRALHQRARLGILTCLCARGEDLSFPELRYLCGLTAGNLSRHLQILSDAGITCTVRKQRRYQYLTCYRLTPQGRERFAHYLNLLGKVLKAGAAALSAEPPSVGPPDAVL